MENSPSLTQREMGEKTQVANIWIFRLINDTLLELALSQFIPLRNKINKIGGKKKRFNNKTLSVPNLLA